MYVPVKLHNISTFNFGQVNNHPTWQWAQYVLDNLEDIARALAELRGPHTPSRPPGSLTASSTTIVRAPKAAGPSNSRRSTRKSRHHKQVVSSSVPNSHTKPRKPNNEDREEDNDNDEFEYAERGSDMDEDATSSSSRSSSPDLPTPGPLLAAGRRRRFTPGDHEYVSKAVQHIYKHYPKATRKYIIQKIAKKVRRRCPIIPEGFCWCV
jgi:hypothetical protein